MPIESIITIILLSILIILVVILLAKRGVSSSSLDIKKLNDEQEKRILDDNSRLKNDINEIRLNTSKDLGEFKEGLNNSLEDRFKKIEETLNNKLLEITKEMNKSVNDNFSKTNQSFVDIQERIVRIDEAQKNLQKVETTVDSFKEILTNSKARGNYGEFQLNTILKDVFGEKEGTAYFIQKTLSNGKTVDAQINLPEPLGLMSIDSKFPFDNYKKMVEAKDPNEKANYQKIFNQDIKTQIDDIADKYIIKNETADQAMMFIPSEAVYAEIQANFTQMIEHARKKRIWIVSPTTMIAVLETIVVALRDQERNKSIKEIMNQLNALSEDFRRYEERWDKFKGYLDKAASEAEDIKKSADKISGKFKVINKQALPEAEETNEE